MSEISGKILIKEINEENKEFSKLSKEEVNTFFDVLNENKILGWESKLLESKLDFRDFSKVLDEDIISEEYKEKKIIRIIKGDIVRTKAMESVYMINFKEYLYQMIIYYINKNNILYKQGLNEIAGPFILLKYKFQISFTKLYIMLSCFIDKFLTNYFIETDFYSLKSSLSLINLLLRYHSPEVFQIFENSLINPDLYATSWLLTLFANKCSLNVVYHLWDKIILFNDPLFIHFFIIAYLIKNKNKFFEVDCNIILSILSQLRINDLDEVNEVIEIAIDLRDNTPYSFYLFANNLDIFNYGSKKLKELYEKYNPDNMLAIPLFPSEIFFIIYKDIIKCPDDKCKNFLNKKNNIENKEKCIFCRNKNIKNELFYVIFDLRIFNSKESNFISSAFPGFLPKTITISNDDYNNKNFPKNILKEYLNDKEKTHFIIMTSDSEYFFKFENEFYIRKKGDKRGSKAGIFYKMEKELNLKKANELKIKNKNKYNLLIEYDNFKKLVEEMNFQGFKNVSYVYGGYKNVHSFAIKNKLELLEHKEKCILCQSNKKKSYEFKFFKIFK